MKVLTLHQPWATLIALGVKTIETRPNRTYIRGRIAIHAASKPIKATMVIGDYEVWPPDHRDRPHPNHPAGRPSRIYANHAGWLAMGRWAPLPLGAIVATANLVDCVPMLSHDVNRPGSDYPRDYPRDYLADLPAEGRFDAGWWILGPSHGGPRLVNDQVPYGHFAPGRWAWLIDDIQPLAEPVPFKGGQGWSKRWTP